MPSPGGPGKANASANTRADKTTAGKAKTSTKRGATAAGKKGSKKEDSETSISYASLEDFSVNQQYENMSMAGLQDAVGQLEQSTADARMSHSDAQAEQDAFHQEHTITIQSELRVATKALTEIQKQVEDLSTDHHLELRAYRDKLIALHYYHTLNLTSVASEREQLLGKEVEAHTSSVHMIQIKQQLGQSSSSSFGSGHRTRTGDEGDRLQDCLTNECIHLQQSLESNLLDIEGVCTTRFAQLQKNLELRHMKEMHGMEERADQHRQELVQQHEAVIKKLQNYYQNVVEEQSQRLQAREHTRITAEAKANSDRIRSKKLEEAIDQLRQPLAVAILREAELKKAVKVRARDKASLRHTRSRLRFLDAKIQEAERIQLVQRAAVEALVEEKEEEEEREIEAVVQK
ncbi:t-lymphocyte triggering factor [Nannochloropsis oceanica]